MYNCTSIWSTWWQAKAANIRDVSVKSMVCEVKNVSDLWWIESFGCVNVSKSCLIDNFILFKTKVVISK